MSKSDTQPDPHVLEDFIQLLKETWNDQKVPLDNVVIDKSDDIGKGRDLGVYSYVEVSTTSPFNISYADIFRASQDIDKTLFVELKASNERERDKIFNEFRRVFELNSERPDTPGNYDRMNLEDVTPLDDETFGAYVYEIVITFEAHARTENNYRVEDGTLIIPEGYTYVVESGTTETYDAVIDNGTLIVNGTLNIT